MYEFIATLVCTHKLLQKNDVQNFLQICKSDFFINTGHLNWLDENVAVDIPLSSPLTLKQIHFLREQFHTQSIDIFCTPFNNHRRKKLLLADMDATIVTSETLDELADKAGIKEKISAITKRAMRGELDFFEALKHRVLLLRGLEEAALQQTYEDIHITKGAQQLVTTMRTAGATCVLVSGGFTFFTEKIANRLNFSTHHGNILEIADSRLTGQVLEPILDKEAKRRFLEDYTASLSLDTDQTLAIGDGANDLPMLEKAGLGIGFHPKPIVQDRILNCIIHSDLTAALYCQGYCSLKRQS